MSKIMIWVGQFDSEADFEKYMDQSAFRQWWKDYDEDNKELRCQFCKELGVMSYDEDFLIMKFTSDGLAGLLNLIPADTQKISLSMADSFSRPRPPRRGAGRSGPPACAPAAPARSRRC